VFNAHAAAAQFSFAPLQAQNTGFFLVFDAASSQTPQQAPYALAPTRAKGRRLMVWLALCLHGSNLKR
jgi:hypothetical protein